MQAATLPPPSRGPELSPTSTTGSDWSGVNTYGQLPRNDGPYSSLNSLGDDYPPPKSMPLRPPPPNGAMNFGGPGPFEYMGQPRLSDQDSRGSSRAGSIAHSRSSDGTISDEQSRKYRRMEADLFQHYTVLKNYLKGLTLPQSRPNKARDKLLRLSPVQFHELSTDVFDELQRRQASAPLPGRPPRPPNMPPFLQPRPDFHEKRNQARQKLSSLPTPRFKDLSTDVFCELERRFPQFLRPDGGRRESSRSRGPGSSGSSRDGFGLPPRSQSFGLNGPPGHGSRQNSVNTVPQFDNPPGNYEYGRPMPRQFQSNTITPNKSVMIEDEDETRAPGSRYDRSSDAFGLESSLTSHHSNRDTSATSQSGASYPYHSKVSLPGVTEMQEKLADAEANLDTKDAEIRQWTQQGDEWKTERQALEKKLETAEALNKSLTQDLEKMKVEQTHYSGDNTLWKSKFLTLESDHASLRQQLAQQRELTDEVSRQGQQYLQEMRAMAESGTGNFEREEKLQAEVNKLQEEVKEWKGRYVKTKTQLRSVRASSLGLSITRPDAARHALALQDPDGLVQDVHVTKFQMSIDELLRIARADKPEAVLDHMKTVVLAVRGVTSDVDAASAPATKDDEVSRRRAKLKSKVSATANNLITASKNFASAQGLSPVSLVDAAASHLTAAVVDLLHAVKIRPSPPGELGPDGDDDGLEPLQSNGYFNIAESLRRRSAIESVYSALSTPSDTRNGAAAAAGELHRGGGSAYPNGAGLGIKSGHATSQEEADLEDLKMYLEDQTDGLVQSITAMVDAIRNNGADTTIHAHITTIAGAVENVVKSVERTSAETSSYQTLLTDKSRPILTILEDCRSKLLQASTDSTASPEFKQKLPPLAFQVARETKELVSRIMAIEATHGDDDFS